MKITVIENTDIRISRLALGTASLHHLFNSAQRQRLLAAGASAGITHFDTSPYYGYGLAECALGVFLLGQRRAFSLATKVGLYAYGTTDTHAPFVWARKALGKVVPEVALPVVNWQVDRAQASLHHSLKRLKTDYIDLLFLHEPDEKLIKTDEFMRWIESEHTRGTVLSWGLAGVAHRISPWVGKAHPLARVVQTQDSLDKRQADFMFGFGRELQFTYGYLSSQRTPDRTNTPEVILSKALKRNTKGSVIVSTRSVDRIAQLARVAS